MRVCLRGGVSGEKGVGKDMNISEGMSVKCCSNKHLVFNLIYL